MPSIVAPIGPSSISCWIATTRMPFLRSDSLSARAFGRVPHETRGVVDEHRVDVRVVREDILEHALEYATVVVRRAGARLDVLVYDRVAALVAVLAEVIELRG